MGQEGKICSPFGRHRQVHGGAGEALVVGLLMYTAACFGLSHP